MPRQACVSRSQVCGCCWFGGPRPGRAWPGRCAPGHGGAGGPSLEQRLPQHGPLTGDDWATTRAHLSPPHFTAPHSPLAEASQVAPPLSPSPGWRHPPQCPPQGRAGPEGEGRERGLTVCTGETSDGPSDHPLPSTSRVPGRPLSRLSRPGDEVTGRAHPVLQAQSLSFRLSLWGKEHSLDVSVTDASGAAQWRPWR